MAGLAVYSSLSIYNLQRQLGVVGVTDTQYTGSANAYLASTPYASAAQKLYAYKFQRNCASAPNNGGPFCASVPSSGFPFLADYTPGQAQTNTTGVGFFVDRAYVDPQTGVGATGSTVLAPIHIQFVPKPPTPAPTTPAPTTPVPTTPAPDYCAGSPCQNGGACANGASGFTCTCAAGYTGATCDTVIDNCASSPCQNGGTCTNVIGAGTFTCACAPGYTGATCGTVIDNCASSPCQNGGACTNVIGAGTFTCACAPGYTGATCSQVLPLFCETPQQLSDFTASFSSAITSGGNYLTTAGTFSFFNISLCASPAVSGCLNQNVGGTR